MNYKINYFSFVLLFFISNRIVAQDAHNNVNEAILGSIHMTNYFDNNAFTPHAYFPGVAIEYRKNIDTLSNNLHIAFGIGIESVPIKIVGETNDFYRATHINLTSSLGLYYSFLNSYYLGLYSSLDIPFAHMEKSEFNGSIYENKEFDFQYLNINFSAGLNFGKIISIKESKFIVELHFKALGILGLKSNDYWHYPEGGIPYFSGVRFGFMF